MHFSISRFDEIVGAKDELNNCQEVVSVSLREHDSQ